MLMSSVRERLNEHDLLISVTPVYPLDFVRSTCVICPLAAYDNSLFFTSALFFFFFFPSHMAINSGYGQIFCNVC